MSIISDPYSMGPDFSDDLRMIYPNGGEMILDDYIDIKWQETGFSNNDPYLIDPYDTPDDSEYEDYWYEILFTPDFIYNQNYNQNWIQIANIPSFGSYADFGVRIYRWNIPEIYHSSNCRVGVRKRYRNGARSFINYSDNNFNIVRSKVYPPSVLSPVSNYTYGSHVPISITYTYENSYMQRNLCDVYIKSEESGMPWKLIYKNLSIYNNTVYFDTRNLKTAKDYEFKFIVHDDINNMSNFVVVPNVSIHPDSSVYIDFNPPMGSIDIQSNSIYSNERNITVDLDAYDEGTDVKTVKIFSDEDPYFFIEEAFSSTKGFILPKISGTQTIKAQFFDYAGNVVQDTDSDTYHLVKYDKGISLYPTAMAYPESSEYIVIPSNEVNVSTIITDDSGLSIPTDPDSINLTVKDAVSGEIIVNGVDKSTLTNASIGEYSYTITVKTGVTYAALWKYVLESGDDQRSSTETYGPYAISGDQLINNLYVAYGGDSPVLYKDNFFVANLNDICTFIMFYKDIVYVGLRKIDGSGYLQKLILNQLSTVYSFSGSDSYVVYAIEHEDGAYIALANGQLYLYKNGVMTLLKTFSNKITCMESIQGMLYVSVYLSTNIYIYTGNDWIVTGALNE